MTMEELAPQPAATAPPAADQQTPAPAPREPAAARVRTWGFRAAVVLGGPVVFVLLLEGALALFGYGVPTDFFEEIPARDAYTSNQRFGWQFFPPAAARAPEPLWLAAEKGPKAFRVFVLGGSAAAGVPNSAFGLARVLEVMLRRQYPQRRVEVINAAMVAINSHVVRSIAAQCAEKQPDLFVVYLGHNEAIGPYGPASVHAGFTASRSMVRLGMWFRTTRAGQLFGSLLGGGKGPAAWRGMEMFVENRVAADDNRLTDLYGNLRENLIDICAYARDAGASTILCTVATNLRDCPPFASAHRAGLPDADRRQWQSLVDSGTRGEKAGQFMMAMEPYLDAAKIDDAHAELHYRIGQCALRLFRIEDARKHFVRARDLDTLRFRADSKTNQVIREVAGRTDLSVRLADAEKILSAGRYSRHGICGREMLHEHVHLTFQGNCALASAVFGEIVRGGLLGQAGGQATTAPAPVSVEVCGEALALGQWDRHRMLADIAQMAGRPPFTFQLGHAADQSARLKALAASGRALTAASFRQDARLYRRAIKADSEDVTLRAGYARMLAEMGDLDAAVRQWKAFLERLPDNARARNDLAAVLVRMNKLDEARTHFDRVARALPDEPVLQVNLAGVLLGQGRPDEAIRHLGKALEARPDYAPALRRLGDAYAAKRLFDQAVERYKQAAKADPDDIQPLKALGNLYLRMGNPDEAARQYHKALEVREDDAVHNNLGGILVRQGRPADAVEHFRKTLEIQPRQANVHTNLASALLMLKRPDDAVRELEEALKIDPDSPQANSSLGWLHIRRGKVPEGLVLLLKAVEKAPRDLVARSRLANALSMQGRFADVVKHYEVIVAAQPDNLGALIGLGVALSRINRFDEGIQHIAHAVRLQPDPRSLVLLASVLNQAGREAESARHFRQALKMKADFVPAMEGLAWLLATAYDDKVRDGDQAVALAGRACELTKYRSVPALESLAAGLGEQGRFPQAIAAAQKALKLAVDQRQINLAKKFQGEIRTFQAGQPLRRRPPATQPSSSVPTPTPPAAAPARP